MLSRAWEVLLVGASLLAVAPAQKAGPAADKLNREAAEKLGAHAEDCWDAKSYAEAVKLWREVVREYHRDDAAARAKLGFTKVGSLWSPNRSFRTPPDAVSSASRKRLGRAWLRIARDLARKHGKCAELREQEGDDDAARHHRARMLRFAPDDGALARSLGYREVEGLWLDPVRAEILARSRMIMGVAARLRSWRPDVRELAQPSGIATGGLEFVGRQTAHFRVWGNASVERIEEFARHLERGRVFADLLFAGSELQPLESVTEYVVLGTRADFHQTLRANAGLFPPAFLKFLLEYADYTPMRVPAPAGTAAGGGTGEPRKLRLCHATFWEALYDLGLRWPVQDRSGLVSDALVEGLGHACACWFFGETRNFGIDPVKAGTVTPGEAKPLLPSLEQLARLCEDSAWQKTDTPAGKLPLIRAGSFGYDARLKAWSFVDYLCRRGPEALAPLDEPGRRVKRPVEGVPVPKSPMEVEKLFDRLADPQQLRRLEHDWRSFWTFDADVRTRSLASAGDESELVESWLAALWELRRGMDLGPVAYLSMDAAGQALAKRFRRPKPRQGKPLGPWSADVAEKFVVAKRGAVDLSAGGVMALPGYRDVLLHPGLALVAVHGTKSDVFVEPVFGPLSVAPARVVVYPRHDQRGVPVDVAKVELGAGLPAAVVGREAERVGYPLSLHLGGMVIVSAVECEVGAGSEVVEGFVHVANADGDRRNSGAGMVVFYPGQALPAGATVKVRWKWRERGEDEEQRVEASFRTR